MPRGTGFAVLEIIWWMLVAAALGFAIGWLIRRWIHNSRHAEELAAVRSEQQKQRANLEHETAGWKSKAEQSQADLDKRTADADRLATQLSEREQKVASLEDSASKARSAAAKLQSKVEDRESTIASLRKDIGREDSQLGDLRKELDVSNGVIGTLRKDADGYKNTIDALRIDMDNERRKQASLGSELEDANSRVEAAETSLAHAKGLSESLQARVDELEASAGGDDSSAEIARLKADLSNAQNDRAAVTEELQALQREHESCETSIAVTIDSSDPMPAAEEEDLPDKDVAVAKVAEIAARTRGDGPLVEDDLKKIHGVGPKLEKLLKSMDITSFQQVANFTEDDIRYVTAALDAFPGRIERDDWMTSAGEQHAAKYGAPV